MGKPAAGGAAAGAPKDARPALNPLVYEDLCAKELLRARQFGATWGALGDVAVQGNLDPVTLLGAPETMFRKADAVLASAAGRPGHIFNLGHGVLPGADLAQVRALVAHVQEKSAR